VLGAGTIRTERKSICTIIAAFGKGRAFQERKKINVRKKNNAFLIIDW
jgi:hypothetical protein